MSDILLTYLWHYSTFYLHVYHHNVLCDIYLVLWQIISKTLKHVSVDPGSTKLASMLITLTLEQIVHALQKRITTDKTGRL